MTTAAIKVGTSFGSFELQERAELPPQFSVSEYNKKCEKAGCESYLLSEASRLHRCLSLLCYMENRENEVKVQGHHFSLNC